jgi:hypothetical protein
MDHVTNAHLAAFDPLAESTHSFHDFLMRESALFFVDRYEQRRGDAVPGNRYFFAARNAVQQFG